MNLVLAWMKQSTHILELKMNREFDAENAFYTTVVTYIVVGVITFGHFWVKYGALPASFPPELFIFKAVAAGIVSFLWPLYWSVQFWS